MKIAVIGSGISGLTAAWYLQDFCDVTLFESDDRAGGHTDTHSLRVAGQNLAVDSGFIVFNKDNYPGFTELLRSLNVGWRSSNMSFSVVNERSGLVYAAADPARLLARKRNFLRGDFLRMLLDIRRFYRKAFTLLQSDNDRITLGDWLQQEQFSTAFIENHILPMTAALWSASTSAATEYPARHLVAFMANHRMLQFNDRPDWLTVEGGSSVYVRAISNRLGARLRLSCPVHQAVRLDSGRIRLSYGNQDSEAGQEDFDQVIMACHSDQALRILARPNEAEQRVLAAIQYQPNEVVIHSDIRELPPERAAWSAWNVRLEPQSNLRCRVSYLMNILQGLPTQVPVIVSLNPGSRISEDRVWLKRQYSHPVYNPEMLQAQKCRDEINGVEGIWYCGAYWGWGFHEDGLQSALDVVTQIQKQAKRRAA